VIDSAATAITEIGKVKDGVSESVSGISDSLKNVTDTLDILREKTGI
jgi:hypothetical protein